MITADKVSYVCTLLNHRIGTGIGRRRKQDVLLLKELIEAGEFRAVIDRRYPMDKVVEAHRYVETWLKPGNVVLTIATDGK